MTTSHRTLHCSDDVNQPYARVRDALLANPNYVFRHATAASASQDAALRVGVGHVDFGVDVTVKVLEVLPDVSPGVTKLTLAWSAAHLASLFPIMSTTVTISARSATETRIELDGTYRTPLGTAGKLVDAAVGYRVAEAAVTRFVSEVAGWLREELTGPTPPASSTPPPERDAGPVTVADVEC